MDNEPNAQAPKSAGLTVRGVTVSFSTTRTIGGETVKMGLDTTVAFEPGVKQMEAIQKTQAANIRRVQQLLDEYAASLKAEDDGEDDPFLPNASASDQVDRPAANGRPPRPFASTRN